MSEILRKDTPGKEDILNLDIDSRTLGFLYSQMAEILLEHWKLDFDCIGCLGQDKQSKQYMVDGGSQRAHADLHVGKPHSIKRISQLYPLYCIIVATAVNLPERTTEQRV